MKKVLITTLVVLLVCVSVSHVQAYTNEEYNFSIAPPSGWTVDDTTTGAAVFFYGPTEEGFMVNVNIQVESLPTTMTLEEYASAAKEQLAIAFSNYELVSEGTRVINEVNAYELVSTFTQGEIDLKMKQVLLVKAKKAYVITYGALPTTYQKYLSAFESSVETFKIIEPTPWYIEYWYVWLIIAVAVAALAFYIIRRRTKAVPPPTPPAPPTPPPAAAPPTALAVASKF